MKWNEAREYETVTAADLRVGDVIKTSVDHDRRVTSANEVQGTSTVRVAHATQCKPKVRVYGLTHPFERLIVPTTERVKVRAKDLRVGDVIVEGLHQHEVVDAYSWPQRGTVSVVFAGQPSYVTFGEHFVMRVEREVKS